jgi:1,2-phenylacetyl-CoA epoxidase catalytic subunit
MAVEVEEFINQLNEENEAYFATLPETDTVYWADKMDGLTAAESLKPRWFNEIRGVEIIGRFIGRVPDLSLKALVGRQVGDEAKHARHCRRRIEALGGSVIDYQPSREQLHFGDLLDAMAYPEEFFAAQQLTVETQSIKRNEKALSRFDPETATMFEKHINPDERFHARLGHLGLQVFARTTPAQDRARRACEVIREAHVAMVRAHSNHMLQAGYLGA